MALFHGFGLRCFDWHDDPQDDVNQHDWKRLWNEEADYQKNPDDCHVNLKVIG